MAQTVIRGTQVLDGTIQRADLDTTTAGQAVVAKVVQGSGITLSSTGADSGTGDVTVSSSAPVLGFVTKSGAYTLLSADSGKYFICSGGSWTLSLPTVATGLYYQVRNDMGISGTTGTITIARAGSATIDGAVSIALLPGQQCTIYSDGTNWRTFGLQRIVVLGTQDIISAQANGVILLPVGYRLFELEFANYQPAVSNNLYLQFSVNGGSSWITTGYYAGYIYNSSTTAAAFFDQENVGFVNFISNPVLTTAYGAQGKATLYPGTASVYPSILTQTGCRNPSAYQNSWGGVVHSLSTLGPVNALQYYASSGNINACSVTVKGVV